MTLAPPGVLTPSRPFSLTEEQEARVDIRLGPSPTEIACLRLSRVYEWCMQQDRVTGASVALPPLPGAVGSVACDVTSTTSLVQSVTPTGSAGELAVVAAFSLDVSFTLSSDGQTFHLPSSVLFTKSVLLCAPPGAHISCGFVQTQCLPPAVADQRIVAPLIVCTEFVARASVHLLVPSAGYCTPSPCAPWVSSLPELHPLAPGHMDRRRR